MNVPAVIDVVWLHDHVACPGQVARFRATFGKSAEVSRANAIRAAEAGLDLGWLADALLDYAPLRAYEARVMAASLAYARACAPHMAAFRATASAAHADYDRAYKTARSAHAVHAGGHAADASLAAFSEAIAAAAAVRTAAIGAADAAFHAATAEQQAGRILAMADALADALGLP